ncbi:MAG TPA: DUF4267 domain-containing protein [Candidatus Limnocylindria bacterium]|jgi:hypothetical protein|nr:DUF4267 domain-containing protein [Candidatus Limnocylindria bacterium]
MLARALGAAFVAIGTTALAAPRFAAAHYGIAVEDADALAFVRAAGARDAALGLTILGTRGDARRVALAAAALVGIADAAILTVRRGPRPQLAAHLGGFAALALATLGSTE